MGLQLSIFLNVRALKSKQEQERISLKGGSSLKPLRKGRSSTAQLQKYRKRKTSLNLNPTNRIKSWREHWCTILLGRDWGSIGERSGRKYRERRSGSECRRRRRLAIAINLWEIISRKNYLHSVSMLWNSVDLRRKYTRRTQDRPNCLIIDTCLIIFMYLPSRLTIIQKISRLQWKILKNVNYGECANFRSEYSCDITSYPHRWIFNSCIPSHGKVIMCSI